MRFRTTTLLTVLTRLIPIVALHLAKYSEAGQHEDPTLDESVFIVWTSTELSYSIISATFPILRPLVNNFNTSWGGGGGDWSTVCYGADVQSPQASNNYSNKATGGHTIHERASPVATSIDESDEGDSLRSRRAGLLNHERFSSRDSDYGDTR